MNDYLKYRGKCKDYAEKLSIEKGYRLVRGYYYDPIWNTQEQHWWCEDSEGNIVDPTKDQFPTKGAFHSYYQEFNGYVECAQCGREIKEEDAEVEGSYAFCSYRCHGKFVGVF